MSGEHGEAKAIGATAANKAMGRQDANANSADAFADVDRGRALAEIDENLIRRDLTAAQRAKLVAKRKAAYEAVHPETKKGGDRRSKSQVGTLKADAFVNDTAAKSGRSRTAVARDATRAKALGADLDRVAGTSLDKGAELDAFAATAAPSGKT